MINPEYCRHCGRKLRVVGKHKGYNLETGEKTGYEIRKCPLYSEIWPLTMLLHSDDHTLCRLHGGEWQYRAGITQLTN